MTVSILDKNNILRYNSSFNISFEGLFKKQKPGDLIDPAFLFFEKDNIITTVKINKYKEDINIYNNINVTQYLLIKIPNFVKQLLVLWLTNTPIDVK